MTEVHVTAEDIANGQKGECLLCPVALAMDRAFCCNDIWVGGYGYSRDGIKGEWRPLPFAVKIFVTHFDAGHPVEPFTFTIED